MALSLVYRSAVSQCINCSLAAFSTKLAMMCSRVRLGVVGLFPSPKDSVGKPIHRPVTTPLSLQARTYEKCSIFARMSTNDLSRGRARAQRHLQCDPSGSRLRRAISLRACHLSARFDLARHPPSAPPPPALAYVSSQQLC